MPWLSVNWGRLFWRTLTAVAVAALSVPLALYFALTVLFRLVRSPRTAFWRPKQRDTPPPALQDPQLGEHAYVTLPKGIKLHYVEKGDKTRPLMLFLHGFPEFWFSWKYQLQEFSSDYWTVAVDLRGYGDSDKPSGAHNYRADVILDDVKELMDALGRTRATLVGHGWGGVIGWLFLERYPERVERLVSLGAPHPVVFQRALTRSRRQLSRSWYVFLFQVPWLPELLLRSDDLACLSAVLRRGRRKPPTVSDEDVEAYKYTFGKPGALTGPLNYYRASGWGVHRRPTRRLAGQHAAPAPETTEKADVPEEPEDTEDNQAADAAETLLETSRCADTTTASSPPCLLVMGSRDAYLEHDTAFRTRKFVPNVSVVVIRDANHFVQLDDPVAVNSAIRDFFAK